MRYANWFVTTVSGASIALLAGESLAQVKAPADELDVESRIDAKLRSKAAAVERRDTRRIPVIDANASFRASQLIGTHITDSDGQVVGKIVDFVSDARGNIQFPIISYLGASGFTGKLFAIPYSGLTFAAGANNTTTAQFSFDPSLLKNAPSFTSSQFPNFSDQTYLNELKAYYHDVLDRRIAKDPTVPANGPGDRVQTQDQAGTPTQPIDPTLPANGPGDRPATVNPALPTTGTPLETTPAPTDPRIPGTTGTENAGFPANTTRSSSSVGRTGSPAGSAIPGGTVVGSTGSPASSSSFAPIPRSGAGADASGSVAANRIMLRSSQMVGMSLQGQDGKAMGKVIDFVGDNNGYNHYAVVSMGESGRNVVVPFNALNFQAGTKGSHFATLRLGAEQLKNAPSFSGNEWPNFADSQVTNGWAKFYERFNYHNGIYPVNAGSPQNSGTPAIPKAGPVGSRPDVPRAGGPGPRIPNPGVRAPGIPGIPGLPGRAPGGVPGKGPGVPAPGGAPGGGAPGGGAPGGGAPGGGGARPAGS